MIVSLYNMKRLVQLPYNAESVCRQVRSQCLNICNVIIYRGADKSLARPGRKQATAIKLQLLQATPKKKNIRNLSVQSGLRDSNDLRVGRTMATFKLFLQSGQAKDLSAPL